MNEQRTQAYLNLINQLLTCNQGDEPQILQDNQELLDQGLIETMVAVAQQYGEAGRENEAQWLMNVAQQLAATLGLLGNETTETANTPEDYLNFLMEVLQKVGDNPNTQLIYPFLAQNIDKLDENLIKILKNEIKNTLASVETEEATYIAEVIFNFSKLILECPFGSIDDNIEIAITGYEIALTIVTFDTFFQNWAATQNSLGNAYRKRIKGDKAENLERAITHYQEALKVFTFESFPQNWAMTQENLAFVYIERIRGDKADNLERAITHYQKALKVRNFESFPVDWANTQYKLAIAYAERIRGDKAENLERAVAACTEVLKVYAFDAFPVDWARTQNNLGNIYRNRIRGDKAENLEKAITACTESLKVYTFDTFPVDWAITQNSLALAYSERIRGDKAENLERAITGFTESLKVRTVESFPVDWAMTKNSLANAYSERIRGDKAENLERAITYFTESLKVRTVESFPVDWAMTQNNLANAYSERIRGDKAENLERAITSFTEALKVRTFNAFPSDWAGTQNDLAAAYSKRIRGDKAENLERAITGFTEALKVYTFDDFPIDWAMTQNNLAITYRNRIRGDKAENLEQAIAAYTEALTVYIFDAFPINWAMTQSNLALAYSDRIRGDKAENLEQAIAACTEALKVYTVDAFPVDWARTQNNLALAYSERIRGDKVENLEKAIKSYHNALQIRTKEDAPLSCLQTANNLATLHYNEKQWQPATEADHIAIEAVENARLEALNPQSRQETLSNAIGVFHRIVQAHLNLNQPDKALEYIERSKARNLVELMTQKNVKPQGVSQEIIDQLDELRERWVNEQIRLQSCSINQNISNNDKLTPYISDDSHLKEYRQAWEDFIDEKITPIDPNFKQTQIVQPIPFKDIQALTDAETCLLQWYITSEKILAFVVSSDGDIKYWESSETELQALFDAINNYLQLYYSKNGKTEWINQLPNLLQTFADTLHINDILSLIPDTCKRLIIIPHRYLHILPLHALPVSDSPLLKGGWGGSNRSELHDLFPRGVQYAPSCQLLKIAQGFNNSEFNKLFAIQNPTKDLLYTDLEVNILSNFFTESQIIAKDNATKNAVIPHLKPSDSHCHHFSCHGGFDPNNPLESALFLANKEPLTLGEIFELRLNQCRLVTLSACETGLIDPQSLSDEYIGLPSGFLFAGSPSVVSSLWTVSDLSTSFLMMKFYEILLDKTQQVSVGVALKESQDWSQNLTVKEIEENLAKPTFQQALSQLQQTLSSGDLFELEDAIALMQTKWKTMSPEDKPFNNPFYWAGFVASGV
jgi:CHAT domain-containing protein